MTTGREELTQPLESVTVFFGVIMLLALLAGAGFALFQPGGGFLGIGSQVCVTQPDATYGSSAWSLNGMVGVRPGASASVAGTVSACLNHASAGQTTLYVLTQVPDAVLWGGILLLLFLMIRTARREGPFTPGVATAMRRLGWFIIIGSVTAATVRGLALAQLLGDMLNGPSQYPLVAWAAVRSLVPVPALAGAALLTLANITRLGATMDDEIKGTV
ncbi:MAG TPA: hypothetical protein VGS19_10465 [Streptosporangiaceae bacterium]|nr:hypothetical protein [Streptosporangiaceae bacterium]